MSLGIYRDAAGNLFKYSAEEAKKRGLRPYTEADAAADQEASAERAATRKARVGTPENKAVEAGANKGR